MTVLTRYEIIASRVYLNSTDFSVLLIQGKREAVGDISYWRNPSTKSKCRDVLVRVIRSKNAPY